MRFKKKILIPIFGKINSKMMWYPNLKSLNRAVDTSKSRRRHEMWSFSGSVHIAVPGFWFVCCILFSSKCPSKITLQKISWSLISRYQVRDQSWVHKMTSALEALAGFQIRNCMLQLSPHSRCIPVTALKFPKHVELHLCMLRSVSVSLGLSRPVSSSHLCLFIIEAFLYLSRWHCCIW